MGMETRAPLIVFGEDWGRHPSSTQHLIKPLGQNRPVVWVNSIGMRRPRLTARDMRRAAGKLTGLPRPSGKTPTNRACYRPDRIINPHALSLPGNPIASAFNRLSVGAQVRNALATLAVPEKPILWLSLPTAEPLVGAFGEVGVVYYAGDDFAALEGVDHEPVARHEANLAEKADVIIAASAAIAERFPAHKTFIIPHGCDVELFGKRTEPAPDLRPDPRDCRPVAGFYGSLSGWLNQDLIAATALQLPDWRFVFIGEERCDLRRLQALENVSFLGPRAHGDLPRYAQHWDASLIPFLDNAQIRACNPLKLREYLAAGTPIVTTTYPAMEAYRSQVMAADTPEAFVSALRACRNDAPGNRAARRGSVARESWRDRANLVGGLLTALHFEKVSQNATPTHDPFRKSIARSIG